MMKILQISNYYKPHIGGIEQVAHDISESLLNNYEQKIICFSEDKEDKVEMIDGVEVYKCGYFKKISSQALSFSYSKIMKKVMNEFNPDIVIFHFPNPFVAHYLLKYRKRNFKLIVWFHADIVNQKILGKFFIGQTKKLLSRADKIITTSPIYRDTSESLKLFYDKCVVIPCCINEKRLELSENIAVKTEKIKEEYKEKIIVFALGRHVAYKGLTYLVEAAKHLDDKYQILIGGKGPLTECLMEQANDLTNVKFLGRISDSDVVAYINASDIYAFPSITKNEAFGISLAEAMYFSKPAVTFTIPGSGVNYVSINNETGIEVENSNALAFSEAIKKLGENIVLRTTYGDNAKTRVLDLFTFEKFKINVNKLIDTFK